MALSTKLTVEDVSELVHDLTGEQGASLEEDIQLLIKHVHDATLDKVLAGLKEHTGKASGYTKIQGFEQWIYRQKRIGGYQDEEFKL